MDSSSTQKLSEQNHETSSKVYTIDTVTVWKGVAILSVGFLIFTAFFDVEIAPRSGDRSPVSSAERTAEEAPSVSEENAAVARAAAEVDSTALVAAVLPADGVALPIQWGELGKQLVSSGVIDAAKFQDLYATRGGLSAEDRALLNGTVSGPVIMNQRNAPYLLNLLWAFGLANKNTILETGPMQNPAYGGAGAFSSTAGWTLAQGEATDHYSAHALISLTAEEQALVERVSQNIYRPCCGNPTYFPDCNHGMAMLGLLELMAAAGVGEEDMYRVALAVNSYWFPETYLTLATYFAKQGLSWDTVDPKLVLGADYSSSQGYRGIRSQVEPPSVRGSSSGCGV